MLRTENKFILKNKNIDTFFNQNSLYKIYAQRKIFSVYFDTDNFKDFYTSEEGTVPRKKIRFRTYNSLIINRTKFVSGQIEIKYTLEDTRKKKVIDIKDKLENIYFLINSFFNKPRYPKLVVSYDRNYYVNKDKDRFTLDTNIKYNKLGDNENLGSTYFEENTVLEFKSQKTIFNDLTTSNFLDAYKVRFSKYCEGIKKVYQI